MMIDCKGTSVGRVPTRGLRQRPLPQVASVVRRGLLRRAVAEWRRLVEERWWKTQCALREREVQALEGKIRGYEKRPAVVRGRRC